MSVFRTIIVDVENLFKGTASDVEKFCASFVKYLKKAPSAAQAIDNFLSEVGSVTVAAVSLLDPAAEPAVADAIAIVETGIGGLGAAAAAATSGNSLLADLQIFASNVPQLLTSLEIKNPALKATVTKIANLIAAEAKVLIPAVEAWVNKIKSSTASGQQQP